MSEELEEFCQNSHLGPTLDLLNQNGGDGRGRSWAEMGVLERACQAIAAGRPPLAPSPLTAALPCWPSSVTNASLFQDTY